MTGWQNESGEEKEVKWEKWGATEERWEGIESRRERGKEAEDGGMGQGERLYPPFLCWDCFKDNNTKEKQSTEKGDASQEWWNAEHSEAYGRQKQKRMEREL